MVTAHPDLCGHDDCGDLAVADGRCDRHDGKRPSPRIVYVYAGRPCVIEETAATVAKVRFLDAAGPWSLTAIVPRRFLARVPR